MSHVIGSLICNWHFVSKCRVKHFTYFYFARISFTFYDRSGIFAPLYTKRFFTQPVILTKLRGCSCCPLFHFQATAQQYTCGHGLSNTRTNRRFQAPERTWATACRTLQRNWATACRLSSTRPHLGHCLSNTRTADH